MNHRNIVAAGLGLVAAGIITVQASTSEAAQCFLENVPFLNAGSITGTTLPGCTGPTLRATARGFNTGAGNRRLDANNVNANGVQARAFRDDGTIACTTPADSTPGTSGVSCATTVFATTYLLFAHF